MTIDSDYAPQQPAHPAAAYYAGPGHPGPEQPKDLTALGVTAFATAAVATLCTCVVALVIDRAARVREESGLDAVDWSLAVYYAGTVLALLSMVAGFVTGAMWLHRARRNAEVLEPSARHARRSGWAWGGWVTPVVALWFPFQVVRDVRRALTPVATSGLIAFWWVLFVATEIGVRTSINLQGDALVHFENAATARQLSVISAALMVAALAGWGQVLRVITVEQHERIYPR
jgi:TRAP-type C4-dicarboxylate transport system permease small subunit